MTTEFIDYILEQIQDEFINHDELHVRETWNEYIYENMPIPRVTSIINSCNINTKNLMRWSNRQGFKKVSYDNYMNLASTKGNCIHKAIEDYILYKKEPEIVDNIFVTDEIKSAVYNSYNGFKAFWDIYIEDHKIEEIQVERKIITPYYGGTMDLYMKEENGLEHIFDFKSSNYLHAHHFIQLAAYKYALEWYTPGAHHVDSCDILLLDKKTPLCKDYKVDFTVPEQGLFFDYCTQCFFSMMYTFYNTYRVEEHFNRLFREEK